MNRFGLQIWEHLVRTRPGDLTSISNPTAWFDEVGERIEAEISSTTTAIAKQTTATTSSSGEGTAREMIEAAVLARYRNLHPSDMLTDPADPLPDWLTDHVTMLNTEATDRMGPDGTATEPDFTPLTRATEAWLARRPREIVVPISMIDDPLVLGWRATGHTITTRAV